MTRTALIDYAAGLAAGVIGTALVWLFWRVT